MYGGGTGVWGLVLGSGSWYWIQGPVLGCGGRYQDLMSSTGVCGGGTGAWGLVPVPGGRVLGCGGWYQDQGAGARAYRPVLGCGGRYWDQGLSTGIWGLVPGSVSVRGGWGP